VRLCGGRGGSNGNGIKKFQVATSVQGHLEKIVFLRALTWNIHRTVNVQILLLEDQKKSF
jgi:hypothetical protein